MNKWLVCSVFTVLSWLQALHNPVKIIALMRNCCFKSLPTAAIQTNLGPAEMDQKRYLTFHPESSSQFHFINTNKLCVVSIMKASVHNYYLYSSPCRNKWLNPYNSCCGCHFNSVLLSQQWPPVYGRHLKNVQKSLPWTVLNFLPLDSLIGNLS